MTANSLSPAFVKINYSSLWGTHSMTAPSVPVAEGTVAGAGWAFVLRGLELPVLVDGAVRDYVNLLRLFMPTSVSFIDYQVFNQPTPTDIPVPVDGATLSIAGTNSSGTWSKAVQSTFTVRADDFSLFKIVLLDSSSGDNYDKTTILVGTGALPTLINYVTADESWLSARGGGRPNTFLQLSKTLNEALRKRYGMT